MPTSDPFPLVVPLSEYYRRAFEERKQLGPKTGNKPPDHGSTVERIPLPPLPPVWPPPGWECHDAPRDDSIKAILAWFDHILICMPHMEATYRDRRKSTKKVATRLVHDAYRLLRHLRGLGASKPRMMNLWGRSTLFMTQ